jgi:hypothetical protein
MNRTVVLQPAKRTPPNTSRNKSSNTQRTENKTTDVVIHQHKLNSTHQHKFIYKTSYTKLKHNYTHTKARGHTQGTAISKRINTYVLYILPFKIDKPPTNVVCVCIFAPCGWKLVTVFL